MIGVGLLGIEEEIEGRISAFDPAMQGFVVSIQFHMPPNSMSPNYFVAKNR